MSGARIMLESNGSNVKVWPQESEYYSMIMNATNVPASFTLTINEGDKLHFEISRNQAKMEYDEYYSKVYWDPKISYDNGIYKSSELFSITNINGTWDNGMWAAQTYDPDSGVYQNMTKTLANKSGRDESGTGAGPVYMDTTSWDSASLNGYWLSPTSSKTAVPTGYKKSAVKTFTAPRAGSITINFGSKFYSGDGLMSGARIMLESNGNNVKVWPQESEYYSVIMNATNVPTSFTLTINEGDKLHFEVSRNQARMEDSTYYSKVYWDPIIIYPHTESTVTNTQNGREVNINLHGITSSNQVIVAGYNNDCMVELNLIDYTQETETVILTEDVDCIKVMVWQNLSSLIPITNTETIQQSKFVSQ